MIIAGEISGDMHGAKLVQAIKELSPDIKFFGIGGHCMRNAGVETLYDVKDMAAIGFTEVLKRFSFFRKVFKEMLKLAKDEKPDAIIFVDYPGFNLRLAAQTHKLGIKNFYYICPQVWAWNRARIPAMAKIIDLLITIFPFEKEYFKETDLDVHFAGHPLVSETNAYINAAPEILPWQEQPEHCIALLPGSRKNEIIHNLPTMYKAAEIIKEKHPDISFAIPLPNTHACEIAQQVINKTSNSISNLLLIAGKTREILHQAQAAIVSSGTATLETALMQCPLIVTYQVSPLTYMLGKMLIKVEHLGMVNIVAGKEICPEYIQHQATPSTLATAIEPLLHDTAVRREMIEEMIKVREILTTKNPEKNAAAYILKKLA